MKILFNCTVNVNGGAVQNAANFIKYAVIEATHEFIFLVSKQVQEVLLHWGIESANIHILETPSKSKTARLKALKLESDFLPDVVYTMAGPTYIPFKAPHVMGISDPYITHADCLSFALNRSFYEAIFFGLKELVKGVYGRFTAQHFIFQTETSREGFCRRYFFDKDKTSILQNAIGEDFQNLLPSIQATSIEPYKIFVPSAYYPHKNLEIIIKLCESLIASNDEKRYKFITTANHESGFSNLIAEKGLASMIENIGPYSYSNAFQLYEDCHAIFMPSILETFSTSYLEAIAIGKPLIVADRSFSREVCGTYAHYYSPLSVSGAIDALKESVNSSVDTAERKKIIARYGTQKERFNKAIAILEEVFNKGS